MERRAVQHRSPPGVRDPPSSRDVSRRVKGRRLSSAEAAASRAGRKTTASGTRYLDSSSGALHQRTWCGAKDDPSLAVAATAPFSSSSWMMSPPPQPNRRRATVPRTPVENVTERRQFHPSVLRMDSPTQVRLGTGQVAASQRHHVVGAHEEAAGRLSRRSSAESDAETEREPSQRFRTPSPAHIRSPASTMSLSLGRQDVDRGGLLFIDDIAVRDMRRGSTGWPWLRFSYGSQPSKRTVPYHSGSSDSDTARCALTPRICAGLLVRSVCLDLFGLW